MPWFGVKDIEENWPSTSRGVKAILAVTVLGFAAGFGAATFWWSGTVSILRERVAQYQDRLQGATPEEAARRLASLEKRVAALIVPQRRLSDAQKNRLRAAIQPFAPEIKTLYIVHEGTAEQIRYAADFAAVFADLKITIVGPLPG